MTTVGDKKASYSLDATRHGRGPLLEFLLTPQASNLMFEEVVHRVLAENRDKIESSLNHIQGSEGSWRTSIRLIKMSLMHLPGGG